TETTEYLYFRDAERKRISRNGSVILERWSLQVGDGQERVALVDRWTIDSTQREVDAPETRTRYHLTTNQASVAIELDESAALLSYEEYFPYGGTSFIAGDDAREVSAKDYRHAGKTCDDATNLYYYGYRYYAPWTCRWLSCDPVGPQDDLNLYQFVRGDPVGNWDADGLDSGDAKLIEYHGRQTVRPTNVSDDAAIAATKTFLGPSLQPAFDSLSRADQLRFAKDRNVALIPRKLGRPSAGWHVVSLSYFKSIYLPKALRYAKAHGLKINVTIPVSPAQKSNDSAASGPPGGSKEGDDSSDDDTKTQSPAGGDTGCDGGKKTDATAGGSGQGAAKDNGDGSGTTGAGAGTTDQGDGNGSQAGTGTAANGAGGSTGATNGPGATAKVPGKSQNGTASATSSGGNHGKGKDSHDGLGGGGGGTHAGTAGGSPSGNEFGEKEGARDDGIIGGTPFAIGDSLEGLASPHSNGSAANGTQTAGHTNGSGRGRLDGSIQGLGGKDAPKDGKQQARRNGGATGNGGLPGSQKNNAGSATAAATAHPNDNATPHGSGEGTGAQTKGETGAMATTLKIAGYLNLTFGEDGAPNGGKGGIPGGAGSHSGRFWQWLYIGVTVVETVLMVESIIKSIASGVLRRFARLLEYLASPRQILRDLRAFIGEGASAWTKFWRQSGRYGPGYRFKTILNALFEDARSYEGTIRGWRNRSFLFKPRWFGTLERVGGESLYTWEHIIPQSVGERFPRLEKFINSYLNSGLRLPMRFNSALGNRLLPKMRFYIGAILAVRRSWQFGTWIGGSLIDDHDKRADGAGNQ
ncbi:MAG: RHS repeat-associated core domain-containing protein, partial [Vulcanimicrobiaceae bacterium]